jgi:hypothetical protein
MFSEKTRTFKAATALARHRLVRPSASAEAECGYPAADYHGPLFVTLENAESGKSVATVPLGAYSGTLMMTAAGAVARLATVCLTGAVGKVDDTGLGIGVGTALQATTEDGEEFEVAVSKGTGLHHAAIAASTAVTASAAATAFSTGSKTIDGSALKIGDILRIKAAGTLTSTGAETVTVDILVGTEVVITTGAVNPADTGDIFRLEVDVVVRVTGASGKLYAHGTAALGTPQTVTAKALASLAELSEDISSTALAIKCQVTNSSTGESVVLQAFSVELVRN